MYFMYDVTVLRPDSDEEFFRGIVDANNPEHAKEKITSGMKYMLGVTTGEISDDQLDIVITKLRDAINDTENGMINLSHSTEKSGDKCNVDSPSVYTEFMGNGTYSIYSSCTGVIRKANDLVTGLTDVEADAVIKDMIFIINHLPDSKNNIAVTGALAALSIDFLEAALLKNLDTPDDAINRNLRMLDRRLASLYHTAGNVTGKPIRPVGYFYCSSGMVNAFADDLTPDSEIFIPDDPETVAPQIQFPTGPDTKHIINDITMSEYEDSLMGLFDEINRFLTPVAEPTAELSVCADSDKLTEVSNRTIGLEMLITEHARELDKINDKLRKLKKKINKGRR